MRITYFANDLTDPATVRRVRILRMGGADLRILGFRRAARPVPMIEDVPAVDLGQTFDGRLVDRVIKVVRCCLRDHREMIEGADALLARNLDLAVIADIARGKKNIPLVYEVLDVNAALVRNNLPAKLLRNQEKRILRRSATLLTSSESYVTNYFRQLGVPLPDIILAENKRVLDNGETRPTVPTNRGRPPWRIGWYGGLRCVESFQILRGLAERNPDLVEIDIRGRPLPEVAKLLAMNPLPNIRFGGAYTQSDLAAMYGQCDLTWGIEYFGQGFNSDWCMPNRLYEGGYYNVPLIARGGTGTDGWLESHGTGVLLHNPHTELEPFIRNLTVEAYRRLQRSAMIVPTRDLVWEPADCAALARRIAGFS